jgi:hypothetical protein
MPIQVTCKHCLTRFNVSEKFAGKKGPCPKCKQEITVPALTEQVVIHAPEVSGPKDAAGQLVLKPIAREEVKVSRSGLILVISVVALTIAAAVGLRSAFESPPIAALALGLIALSPALVWAGYSFLRDAELEPYRGRELWTRVAICAAVYAALWVMYAYLPAYVLSVAGPSEVGIGTASITLAILLGLGTFTAVMCFEFDGLIGFLHITLFAVVTILLALLAGAQLAQLAS